MTLPRHYPRPRARARSGHGGGPNSDEQLARPRTAEAKGVHAVPVRIRQTETDLLFSNVEWVSPGLMRVVQGEKQLGPEPVSVTSRPGELLYLPAGTRLDVRNEPKDGAYVAEGIILSLELARYLPPATVARKSQTVRKLLIAEHVELSASLDACLEAFERGFPEAVQRARLLELLAWLAQAGIDPFVSASDVRLRLKRMLGDRPADPWRLPDVARQLAMSEDTLQRHLRRTGTGFQELLVEVRMEHALALLWTTERPLALVAAESGYDSPSRFAERFRDRFGVLPSELRKRR